jgi:hypothetical protein
MSCRHTYSIANRNPPSAQTISPNPIQPQKPSTHRTTPRQYLPPYLARLIRSVTLIPSLRVSFPSRLLHPRSSGREHPRRVRWSSFSNSLCLERGEKTSTAGYKGSKRMMEVLLVAVRGEARYVVRCSHLLTWPHGVRTACIGGARQIGHSVQDRDFSYA